MPRLEIREIDGTTHLIEMDENADPMRSTFTADWVVIYTGLPKQFFAIPKDRVAYVTWGREDA